MMVKTLSNTAIKISREQIVAVEKRLRYLKTAAVLVNIFADKISAPVPFQKAIDTAFAEKLKQNDLASPEENFHFSGFVEGVIKSNFGISEFDFDDIEQEMLKKFLTPDSQGRDWFAMFKERYDSDYLLAHMKKAIINWTKNWIRDNRPRTKELFDSPGTSDYNPLNLEHLQVDERSIIDDLGSEELYQSIIKSLEKDDNGELLVKIFQLLYDGYSKKEITDALEFKSMSRLSYYISKIKEILVRLFQNTDRTDLLKQLNLV